MLDALDPFVTSLKGVHGPASREILLTAVEAAERGVEATARMKPRLGRSSYLGDRVLGYPDPGANVRQRNAACMFSNNPVHVSKNRFSLRMTVPHDATLRVEGIEGNAIFELSRGQS